MKKALCLKVFVKGYFKTKQIVLAGVLCCLLVFGFTGLGAATTFNYYKNGFSYIESIDGITAGSEVFDVTFTGNYQNTVLTSENVDDFITALLAALNSQSSNWVITINHDWASSAFYVPYKSTDSIINWYTLTHADSTYSWIKDDFNDLYGTWWPYASITESSPVSFLRSLSPAPYGCSVPAWLGLSGVGENSEADNLPS